MGSDNGLAPVRCQAIIWTNDDQPQSSPPVVITELYLFQFDGELGHRMKNAYGEFCSCHIEAVQLYKDLLKSDRKFQTFIKVSQLTPKAST